MISVVVPIFNEEELVSLFHVALADSMKDIGEAWEVLYVNDGSKDSFFETAKHNCKPQIRMLWNRPVAQLGAYGGDIGGPADSAWRCGVLMDGDFQDPPEVVPEAGPAAWRGGAQVVTAVRGAGKNAGRF